MTSISGSSYRPNPDQFHWELRNFFLYYLVREPNYDDVRKRLAPLWEQVLEDRPELDAQTPYYLLPVPSKLPAGGTPDSLMVYIASVQNQVRQHLRCREQGAPSPWVCHAVHAGVNGTPLDLGMSPQHWLWVGSLLISIGSPGFAFVGSKINGHPVNDLETVEQQTIEQPQAGTPFNQWKKLKKLAHTELDRLLEALRDQSEAATSGWPNMYQKGRKTRTQETMPNLVRWVVGGDEQFFGDRSATNDLLQELRLDPPGKSKKFSAKRENISE